MAKLMLNHTEVVAEGISLILCLDLVICDFLLWGDILVCHIEDNFSQYHRLVASIYSL
jgi:hypothetical protein